MSKNHPWTTRVLREGADSREARRIRLDSWANGLTGLNTSRDKTTQTLPYAETLLNPLLLEIMYSTSDIAARVVSALPDECFKKRPKVVAKAALNRMPGGPDRFTRMDAEQRKNAPVLERDAERARVFQGADDAATQDEEAICAMANQELAQLGSHSKQHEAMVWGRLYGLGVCFMATEDGGDPWMPLDWRQVRSINAMTVFDRRDVMPWRWYSDLMAPKFGDVALYVLQPTGVFMGAPYDMQASPNNSMMVVHESRFIRFGGELTGKRERLRNNGADYSVLQKCFRALQLVDNNWQSASTLLADASQAVIKIKGLMDMISQEPEIMQLRMEAVDKMRSVLRALILDADGEEFERKPTPFAGIPDLLDKSWERLSSAARMPKSILMGTSPGSLNATGEMDVRWWYDTVSTTQENDVRPQYELQVQMILAAKGVPNPEDFTVVFPPLWNMSEAEIAKMHLDQANADAVYLDRGVVSPTEIALSRFGDDEYSLDTKIDVQSRLKLLKMETETMQVQAATDLETAKNPPPPPPSVNMLPPKKGGAPQLPPPKDE